MFFCFVSILFRGGSLGTGMLARLSVDTSTSSPGGKVLWVGEVSSHVTQELTKDVKNAEGSDTLGRCGGKQGIPNAAAPALTPVD